MADPQSNQGDPADPFAGIVDDVEAREQARDWAYDALREGRSPEWVEAELRANGWSADDAATLAEEARRRTRHLRGVVTRDDVAQAAAAAYREGEATAFNDGYVGPPDSFRPDPSTPAAPVYAPDPAADRAHRARLRRARVHASLQIAGGAVVCLIGVVLGFAVWGSSESEGWESYLLSAGMTLGGGIAVALGVSAFLRPARLVSRPDRGLLDRRDSR